MHHSITRSLEKAQRPAWVDLQQFWTQKSQIYPGHSIIDLVLSNLFSNKQAYLG